MCPCGGKPLICDCPGRTQPNCSPLFMRTDNTLETCNYWWSASARVCVSDRWKCAGFHTHPPRTHKHPHTRNGCHMRLAMRAEIRKGVLKRVRHQYAAIAWSNQLLDCDDVWECAGVGLFVHIDGLCYRWIINDSISWNVWQMRWNKKYVHVETTQIPS